MSKPIFTDKAHRKMAQFGLSEGQVLSAFNSGQVEQWSNRVGYNSVKKFSTYEVGVAYLRDDRGMYIITSVWMRQRR